MAKVVVRTQSTVGKSRLVRRLLLSVVISMAGFFPCANAQSPKKVAILIFLSPFCGLSLYRFGEALPKFPTLEAQGATLEFHLIALGRSDKEVDILRQLVCADAQHRFAPYFLYVSKALQSRRSVDVKRVAPSMGIDGAQFDACLKDIVALDGVLDRSNALFDAYGLAGVPSVVIGSRAFVFSDVNELLSELDSLRKDRPSSGTP